jgi:hypothetical protein
MVISTKVKTNKLTKELMTTVTIKKPSAKKAKKELIKEIMNSKFDIFECDNMPTVEPAERPTNTLDKKPDDHEAKTLGSLVDSFIADPLSKIAQRNLKKDKKAVSYNKLPYYQEITLRDLLSALAVQRPVNNGHIKKILEGYDEKKVQYVNVLKIKYKNKYYYYIIDGQHTAVTYGVLAKWGYYEADGITADNWIDVKVKCQVVEFHNFTFAREHFLGINGGDKLKLVYFDKWKNYVLSKRQDNPNSITKDLYEDAFAKQVIMESYGITPVHEQDDENVDKPGAFIRVDLLKDLTDEEMHWWCQIHQWNWDYRSVDSSEVLPMVNLRRKIKGVKSLSNNQLKEFVITLGNIIRNTVGSPAEFRRLAESTYKEWFKTANPDEKIPSTPPDVSLALLLQIYYEHGGAFNNVSKNFLDDYDDHGYTLFHALPQELQDLVTA